MPDFEKMSGHARAWVGTPYQHHARCIGIGVDCINLVMAVGIQSGLMEDDPDKFAKYSGYARTPNPRSMAKGMLDHFSPWRGGIEPGCVLWIQWRDGLPMHTAIVGEHQGRLTMIHAYSVIGRVVEHTLDEEWLSRVHSVWVFPGSV